jgi:hypothetical protein
MYALNRQTSILAISTFFMGQGLACVFERHLLRSYGTRFRGPLGRIWMTAVLTITAIPLVNYHHEIGWAGAIRKSFAEVPESSPVQWALHFFGQPSLIGQKT